MSLDDEKTPRSSGSTESYKTWPLPSQDDYSEIVLDDDLLPLPDLSDDLTTVIKKFNSFQEIMSQGKSVAAHSGFKLVSSFEKKAMSRMTPEELFQFNLWKPTKSTSALPKIDWVKNQIDLPANQKKSNIQKKAEAVSTIWKTPGATERHLAFIMKNHPEIMPLVRAVTKVLEENKSGLSAHDDAEYQTLVGIQDIMQQVSIRTFREFNLLKARLNKSMDIVRERVAVIKSNQAEKRDTSNRTQIGSHCAAGQPTNSEDEDDLIVQQSLSRGTKRPRIDRV